MSMAKSVARRGTTPAWLWRLLVALAVAAVAVLATSSWVFQGTRDTAQQIRLRAAPSVQHVLAAKAALVEADAAAAGSFGSTRVLLIGPGDEYQNQIAVASQSLTQLAQDSVAGAAASQAIQLVEGNVVSYTGLVEQADAHYRQGNTVLGAADLWYASRLLHQKDGILDQLTALKDQESEALARQAVQDPVPPLVWVVPLAVLGLLLLAAQLFVGQRFRRTFNLPLVAATLAAVALAAGMGADLQARHELTAARDTSARLADAWQAQIDLADRAGEQKLKDVVTGQCGQSCGATVDRFRVAGPSGTSEDGKAVTAGIAEVDRHTEAAAATGTVQVLVLIAGLLVLLLAPFGLYLRIDEYP
jgi:hypothetical protein